MPILQYETRVSPDGAITLPPIPEYRDRNVVVTVFDVDEGCSTSISEQLEEIATTLRGIEDDIGQQQFDLEDILKRVLEILEQK